MKNFVINGFKAFMGSSSPRMQSSEPAIATTNNGEERRKTRSTTRAQSHPADFLDPLTSHSSHYHVSSSWYDDGERDARAIVERSFNSLTASAKPRQFLVQRCLRTRGEQDEIILSNERLYLWRDETCLYFRKTFESAPVVIPVASAALHHSESRVSVLFISSESGSDDYVFWLANRIKTQELRMNGGFEIHEIDDDSVRQGAEEKYQKHAAKKNGGSEFHEIDDDTIRQGAEEKYQKHAAKKAKTNTTFSDVFLEDVTMAPKQEEEEGEAELGFIKRLRDGPIPQAVSSSSSAGRKKKSAAKAQPKAAPQGSMRKYASPEVDLTSEDQPQTSKKGGASASTNTQRGQQEEEEDSVSSDSDPGTRIESYRPVIVGSSASKRQVLDRSAAAAHADAEEDDFEFEGPYRKKVLPRPGGIPSLKTESFSSKNTPATPGSFLANLSSSTQAKREKITTAKGPLATKPSIFACDNPHSSAAAASSSSAAVKRSHHFVEKSPSPPRPKVAREEISLVEDAEDDEARAEQIARKKREEATRASVVLCIYPPDKVDSVTITVGDVAKLAKEDAFINDSLLDFYLKHIQAKLDSNMSGRIHIFTSFLYSKLVHCLENGPPRHILETLPGKRASHEHRWLYAYTQVWRWTAGLNLLDRDCILFPINQGLHWSLVACCFRKSSSAMTTTTTGSGGQDTPPREGVLLTLDSLKPSVHDHTKITSVIRRYLDHVSAFRMLNMEPKARAIKEKPEGTQDSDDDDDFIPQVVDPSEVGATSASHEIIPQMYSTLVPEIFTTTTLRQETVDVSQQTDGVNCGLHLLNNAEMVVELLDKSYSSGVEDIRGFAIDIRNLFEGKAFRTSNANAKRKEIRELVDAEAMRQAELKEARKGKPTAVASVTPSVVASSAQPSIAAVENTLPEDMAGGFIVDPRRGDGPSSGTGMEAEPAGLGGDVDDPDSLEGLVLPMPAQDTQSHQSQQSQEEEESITAVASGAVQVLSAPRVVASRSRVVPARTQEETSSQRQGTIDGVSDAKEEDRGPAEGFS